MANNSWNKIIYRFWSPIYDQFFNTGHFNKARKEVFNEIAVLENKKILFVGVGTGADLLHIEPAKFEVTAIDFSPNMLEKAIEKFPHSNITFLEMNAQNLGFEEETFDYVVASLILSVVPDADQCFKEMARVLKVEGKIIIFDKFAPSNEKMSLFKRLVRPVISILGTDIGLRFEKLFEHHRNSLSIVEDTPLMWNGMYRKIIVMKTTD